MEKHFKSCIFVLVFMFVAVNSHANVEKKSEGHFDCDACLRLMTGVCDKLDFSDNSQAIYSYYISKIALKEYLSKCNKHPPRSDLEKIANKLIIMQAELLGNHKELIDGKFDVMVHLGIASIVSEQSISEKEALIQLFFSALDKAKIPKVTKTSFKEHWKELNKIIDKGDYETTYNFIYGYFEDLAVAALYSWVAGICIERLKAIDKTDYSSVTQRLTELFSQQEIIFQLPFYELLYFYTVTD